MDNQDNHDNENDEDNINDDDDTEIDDENTIILDLDYMISLKLHLESEYNIDEMSIYTMVKYLYNYLKDIGFLFNEIKIAIELLYDSIDPTKKSEIISILNSLNNVNTFFSQIESAMTNEINSGIIDSYTGDIINPSQIINLFTTNINQLYNQPPNPANNLFYSFNFTLPSFLPLVIPITTNHVDLDKITTLEKFSNLDTDTQSKFNTCLICLDDFKQDSEIRKIKCVHIFHKECIDPWLLKESYSCPLCRIALS